MKNNTTFFKRLMSVLLAAVLVCTMLQCTLFTAFAEDATIDKLISDVNADGKITLNEAPSVNKISVLYDALDSTTQSGYTTAVSAIKTSFYDLISAGLAVKTTDKTQFSYDHWNYISTVDSSVRVKYTGGTNPTIAAGPHAQGKTTVAAADTALDGLEVMINNYYQYDSSAPRAGFAISFTPWLYLNSLAGENDVRMVNGSKTRAGMILYFDLKNSQIKINSRLTATGDIVVGTLTLDEDEIAKLTLANFSHKVISIGMTATGNAATPYQVTIKLSGDSTPITALIPSQYFAEGTMTNSGKVNIGFPAGYWETPTTYPTGNACTSFDVIGYRNNKSVQAIIDSINNNVAALDAQNVKETDAPAINAAVIGYEKLTAFDKGQIADTVKLEALNTALLALIKDGYTTFNALNEFTTDSWSVLNYADGNGRFTFSGTGSPELRVGFKAPVALDGIELLFNRLHQTQASANAGFSILFTPSKTLTYSAKFNDSTQIGLLLYFDLANGQIIANARKTSGGTVVVGDLVTDAAVKEKLKLSNLENKVIRVSMTATDSTSAPYNLTIRVAGESNAITVPIPADYYDSAITNNGKVNVSFTRGYYKTASTYPSGNVYTRFDLVGYRDAKSSIDNITYINNNLATLNVDTLTEANAQVVNKMAAIYETLIPMEKAQITDTAKLEAIITKMSTLVKQGITHFTAFTQNYWAASAPNLIVNTADYARFTFASSGDRGLTPGVRIGATTAVDFAGLELKFNNLQQTDASATVAGFGIIFSTASGVDITTNPKGLLLYIDAKNGDLLLNLNKTAKYKTLIDNSDVLKLSSLEYNAFTVKISETNDAANPYSVTVLTADGETVTANIPADCFDAATVLSGGKTYVTVTPGRYDENGLISGSVYNRFDLVGYKNVAAIDKVNGLIASIPESVTLADSGLVNRTKQYYENLTDAQKTQISGVDKLNAAVATVDSLYAASLADSDYTIVKGNDDLISKMEDMNTWWGEGFASVVDGGGIRLDWNNGTLDVRASLKNAVNMNGLRLKFNRLLKKGGNAEFALYFADGGANSYNREGEGDFALVLNANDGTLKVSTNWVHDVGYVNAPTYVNVIEDELLKYDSIGGGEFVIGLDKQSDGSFKVTVTVGNDSVSGTIPASVFETVKGKLANTGECFLCVSTWYPATQSLDFIGYKTSPDVYTPDVNAWIAALPETVTEADCELLDKIYTKLLIANEEQLAAIQNKDKFYEAMKAYRKLFEFETNIFAYESIGLADATKWWPTSFSCDAIENDGGLRITWKNGGRDVRQGYGKKLRLDGLKLQFNALHKTKETAKAPSLAIMLGDAVGSAWTYNNTTTTRPLAIVLDTENGTLTAQPSGSVLVTDERLKLDNLEYSVFYIEINQNDEKLWQVDVITPTGTVSGVMSVADFTAGERFTNLDSGCFVTLTAWESSTYATIEWTGIGQSTKHHDVSKMIDDLRVIDADSEAAIKAARRAYDALPEYVQNRVANYQVLTDAEAMFLGLDKNYNPIPYVEQRIEELGEIDITSKQAIDDVLELYYTLSLAQQAKLRNKKTLEDAIAKYHKLYAEHMDWDSCVYAPLSGDAYYSQEQIDSWWNGTTKFQDIESGGIHVDLINARRDHRIGLGSFELDGLNIQLSDFKVNGEGGGCGELAISVGPFAPYNYEKGLSLTAKRTFVFVLDTNEGTITLNTAGNKYFTKNMVLFESEKLLYSNIEGKNFSLMFEEIDNFNYIVRFMISDGTLFSAVLPSSVIIPIMEEGVLTKSYISIGAWDSETYQSVNVVSVFDNDSENAVSQVMPVIDAIDELPANVTLENEAQIRTVREHYRTLMKKGLKEQVSNYQKLDTALNSLSELWDANGIDPYEFEMPETEEVEAEAYMAAAPYVSATPLTAEDNGSAHKGAVIAFGGILALGVLALTVRKNKFEEVESND